MKKPQEIKLIRMDITTAIEATNDFTVDNSPFKKSMRTFQSISFLIHSFAPSKESGDHQKTPVLPRGLDECGLKEKRTYLVAGGIRGYGFQVARWMAENGAKSIGLIGRSKPSDAEYQEVRGIETKTGAKFHIFQVICSIFVTVNFHLMQHFYDYISLIRNAVYIHVL